MNIIGKLLCRLGRHNMKPSEYRTVPIDPPRVVCADNKVFTLSKMTYPIEYRCSRCGELKPSWLGAFEMPGEVKP